MNLQSKYDLAILAEKEEEKKIRKCIKFNVEKNFDFAVT